MTASMYFGQCTTNLSTTLSQWLPFWGVGEAQALANEIYVPAPCDGTLQNFRIKLSAAPGVGKSRTFTLRKNSVDTPLVITISGTDVDGVNTSDVVDFVTGDLLSWRASNSGTPAAATAKWTCESRTTNSSDAIIWSCGIRFGNTAQGYIPAQQGFLNSLNTAENQVCSIAPMDITVTAIYVHQNAAAEVAANLYTYYLGQNLANVAATQIVINAPTRDGNVTGLSVSYTAGDRVSIWSKATGNPVTLNGGSDGFGICYTPSVSGACVTLGSVNQTPSTTVVNYHGIQARQSLAWNATQGVLALICGPTGFTLGNFYMRFQSSPGSPRSRQVDIISNGAATGLTNTISNAGTGPVSDTTHSAEIVDGDLLELMTTPTNTPNSLTTLQWGFTQNVHAPHARLRTLTGAGI